MRRSAIDEAAPLETKEIIQAAEEYIREVARKSQQSTRQVEPVIEAALSTLLEWLFPEDQARDQRGFWHALTHDAQLRNAYVHASIDRPQRLPDLIRHHLSHGGFPASARPSQSEDTEVGAAYVKQRPTPSEGSPPIDLIATIAGTGLLLMQAKAGRDNASPRIADPDEQLADLERQNVLRVFDGWQELLARSVGGPEVAKRLGVSRQRLNTLRREDRLLGLKVPIRRELHHPVWQFGEDGQPLPAMPQLLMAAREAGLHPRDLDALMVSADAGEGKTLIEHLRTGNEAYVLGVIRAAGE